MNNLDKNLINEIISLIKNNNIKSAQKKIEPMLVKFPSSDIILNLNGTIFLKNKEYDEAKNNFTQALNANPDFISARLNLGIVYQNLGKGDEALKCFKEVAKKNNKLPVVYNNMGFILYTQNKYSEAIVELNRAIELKKDYAEAYLNLGMVYLNLKKYKKALMFFNETLRYNEKLTSVYFFLAECHKNIGIIDKALSYYALSSHEKTKSRILECYFALDSKHDYEKMVKKISKEDPDDRRIAAITGYISHQFNISNIYPFCDNPINFILKSNIKQSMEKNNFEMQELINEITKQKFSWELFGKTTVKGSSAYNLTQLKLKSLLKLQNILVNEISNYNKNFKNQNCTFIKNWPKKYKFNIWSNILKGEGYNTPHIHPAGWLSGVVYLKMPKSIKKNEAGIEFSLHGEDYLVKNRNIPTKTIVPVIGDLVLFPSSLFHKTIPFKSNEERIVIAFDIHKLQ